MTRWPGVVRANFRVDGRCTSPRGAEAGQVLAIFALAIIALLGAVGLAVDGSRMLEERRNAQAAVDHAALAASFASCTGALSADAIQAGYDSATANLYPDTPPRIDVTLELVDAATHTFRAEIDSMIDSTFARVLGFNTFTASVEATAGGEGCGAGGGGGSGSAIFAGGDFCGTSQRTIKISGNNHTINGGSHTNGGVDHAGNSTTMTGTPSLTYVWPTEPPNDPDTEDSIFQGSGNMFIAPQQQVTAIPWPGGLAPAAMTSTMWNAYEAANVNPTGNLNSVFDNVDIDGVWYTEHSSGVDVKRIADDWEGVIVSKNGPIRLGDPLTLADGVTSHEFWGIGMDHDDNGPVHDTDVPAGTPANVVLVSGYAGEGTPCDKEAIRRSGNYGTWTGLWWAPNAGIFVSGERTTVNGGLISWMVQFEGNYHVINGNPNLFPASTDPTIILLK